MISDFSKNKLDCFVSVVSIIQNMEKTIDSYLNDLYLHLEEHFSDYEIVLIDQCSKDGTILTLERLLLKIPSIRLIQLAYPVYNDVAWGAGLENAIGDFVVIFDPLTDPVNCIDKVVKQCKQGSDIVIGVAEQKQSLSYRVIRPWIQFILHKIGYDLPPNTTSLRCLSRRCVNTVTQTGRFHHQFFVRISKSGYTSSTFNYILKKDIQNKHTLRQGVKEIVRLLVFNSTKPLRWMSALGLMGSILAFLIALYGLLIKIFKEHVIEGWASLVMFMSVLFALLFTILAFFGEYLGRLLDDRSEQRDYDVVSEKTSSVMLEENRYNVLSESISKEVNLVQTGRNK
jgi:glycosyltransferase involved in cell wall biosynthesis